MSEPILFSKYTYREHPPRIEIELSGPQYQVLEEDSKSYDQQTLEQLALSSPEAAYERLCRSIGSIILNSHSNDIFNTTGYKELPVGSSTESEETLTFTPLTSEQSTDDDVSNARDRMMNLLPSSPDADFDLSVHLRLNEEDSALLCLKSLSVLDFSFRRSTTSDQA